jgi:HSP20 family protein
MSNITHWDPFGGRSRGGLLADTFDDWFDRVARQRLAGSGAPMAISIDVTQEPDSYIVQADIPGVKKEDISVSVEGNVVTIGAEVKREHEEKKGETVLRQERYIGQMQRSFSLPTDVDRTKAEAVYADGVLRLTLPKRADAERRTLTVK